MSEIEALIVEEGEEGEWFVQSFPKKIAVAVEVLDRREEEWPVARCGQWVTMMVDNGAAVYRVEREDGEVVVAERWLADWWSRH